MTNPRIQEIEQQILELAHRDAEFYPQNMPAEQISQHHSPALGNWARQIIQVWNGEAITLTLVYREREEPITQTFTNSSQDKLALVKLIRDRGNFDHEIASPETQTRLNELVNEWETLLERERERESIWRKRRRK